MKLSLILVVICLGALYAQNLLNIQNNVNAPDVPNFAGNPRIIAAGSLVIPMDQYNQILIPGTGQMSVLPYGVVIRSLYANVSVSWAIATNKGLNGVDFTAVTSQSNWQALASAGSAAASTSWSGWQNTAQTSYSGGPFIIPAQYVKKALTSWQQWQANPSAYLKTVDANVYNGVHIHILTQPVTIDIRHNIYTHPFIGISNLAGNAPTQTAMMGCIYNSPNRDTVNCPVQGGAGSGALFFGGEAGCTAFNPQDHAGLDWGTHYDTYDCGSQVAALTAEFCLSTFAEPHWEWDKTSGPSYISAVRQFVNSGANFLAQCASTQSYETYASEGNDGTFMATNGIVPLYTSYGINYNNDYSTIVNYADLPVNQYMGVPSSRMWGTVPDFYNAFSGGNDATPAGWGGYSGSTPSESGYNNFKVNAFPLITNLYDSADDSTSRGRGVYVASGAKVNSNLQLGSNVWYLGGHSWVSHPEPGADSNRRFFFNAILIPASRPASCGFSFCDAGSSCDPLNACQTCACDASGSGFKYTDIQGCCLSNGDCTADCTQCNINSHTCELIPGCCSNNINCTTACQSCQNTNAAGVGTCAGTAGCCTSDAQCTTTSKCIHCQSQACVRTPAPACCDSSTDCTGTCMTCNNSVCARQQPLSSCCLTNGDCGGDPCQACNLNTHQCYKVPGCCDTKADCGSNPCVSCTPAHTCINLDGCCTTNGQCGTCQECSNTTNKCVASSDANCCSTDKDCGNCRRCSPGVGGAKTCTTIDSCCLTQGDCESCQLCNTNTSSCDPIPNCCRYDTDCQGCDTCQNYTCSVTYDLSCCYNSNDCEIARQELMLNPNATDIPQCDLICNFDTVSKHSGNMTTGVCQSVCSSPKNWTGLIVGLAAGVPLGLLCLGAIAAGLIAFLLWKRDALTGALLNKGTDPGLNANSNPAFDSPVTVGTSGL